MGRTERVKSGPEATIRPDPRMSPPRARTVLSQQPIDGKTVDTVKIYHRRHALEMPIIPQTHHAKRQRERAGASMGGEHSQTLAHSATATPPPEPLSARRHDPAEPHPTFDSRDFFAFPASPEFPNLVDITPMIFWLLSRIHRGAPRGGIVAGHIAVLFSLLTSGCGPSGGTAGTVSHNPETQAAAEPSTALVLAAVDNGFHRVPIALTTDYGFLVMNAGDDEHPIPSVSVGYRSERRIIQCGSLAEFETALRRIPAGSKIHRHERCLLPASRGLAEDFLAGIEPTLSRVGITVAPEPVITCLCGR